jgi:hypothetical protein
MDRIVQSIQILFPLLGRHGVRFYDFEDDSNASFQVFWQDLHISTMLRFRENGTVDGCVMTSAGPTVSCPSRARVDSLETRFFVDRLALVHAQESRLKTLITSRSYCEDDTNEIEPELLDAMGVYEPITPIERTRRRLRSAGF